MIGNPRSGTSLFRLMLHLHSQICIPPESHFFLWLEEKYSSWNIDRLDDYLNDLNESTKFETWDINSHDLHAFICHHDPKNYGELNCIIYLFYAVKNNMQPLFWGDKNKLWKEKLETVASYYPEARFIHIIRDGRDVVCSFRELAKKNIESRYTPNVPLDIEHLSRRWNMNIKRIMAFQEKIPASQFLVIRYEDLLSHTEREMRKAFEFLGVPFESDVLDYYLVEDPSLIEPKEFLQWKQKLREPIDHSNMGKYKTKLTLHEIQYFNRINSDLLEAFNYSC